jgi:ADP-ribosyl-[dinitrogen reductase] hydrolase
MTDLKNKFDALVARMQTNESKEAALSLFKATPEELAQAYKRGITPRTSTSSPLRIDSIKLGYGDAAIGMTICPGKQGPSSYGGPWQRDLVTDIEVIRSWGCSILLTFMEPGELESYHVAHLGDIAAAAGIRWVHIPITDGDPPDGRFEAVWPVIGREVVMALRAGKRIVINCRGGLGRTGTIACLLLIELGENPQTALDRVRATRPGSVETKAQEAFVLAYSPGSNS